ncbi:MAG: hypothetical protein M9894_29075 [Planctomycetes bacterium]|nr:hypothetical protein [Planctomycetota bacterium]
MAPGEGGVEVVGQGARVGVAAGGVALERAQAHRLEGAVDPAVDRARPGDRRLLDPGRQLHERAGREGEPARERLVEHEAEGPHVDRRRRRASVARELLRRHVGRRPDHRPGVREAAVALEVRQAEVGDARPAVVADEDVVRLEVAVQDPPRVRVAHGARDVAHERHARAQVERPDRLGERPPLDELVDEAGPALEQPDRVDLHQPRVVERRRDRALSQEAGDRRGVLPLQELEGHAAAGAPVARPVDRAEAAAAEEAGRLEERRQVREVVRRGPHARGWLAAPPPASCVIAAAAEDGGRYGASRRRARGASTAQARSAARRPPSLAFAPQRPPSSASPDAPAAKAR